MKIFLAAIAFTVLSVAVATTSRDTTGSGPLTESHSSVESLSNTTTVHPAVSKWKATEKLAKQLTSQIVKQLLAFFVKEGQDLELSPQCRKHLMKTLVGVKNMKLWAFQMLDASGKLPNGVLTGTINSLGDFDGCLKINVSGVFQGKYCTVELMPPLPPRRPYVVVDTEVPEFQNFTKDRDSLIAELIKNANHYYYLNFRTSLCIPSTCSREELENVVQKVIDIAGIGWTTKVSNCEVKATSVKFDAREISILCVFGIVLLLAALGTGIDVVWAIMGKSEEYQNSAGVMIRVFLCFSLYSNTMRLLKKDDSPDTIKIFHGMKVVTLMWVVLNHNYYYVNLQIFESLLLARDIGKDIAFQFVINGFLNVETFFFISAVLVMYVRMKVRDQDFNVALYIFRRLWRLTPPFMFVIAFAFLTPHMGSGPVWTETVGKLVDKCKKNWWTNLLYFNNFVPSEEMCLQWLWYIPVDTHLYLLALFVLMPIKKHPKIGFTVLGTILALSIAASAFNHVFYELTPTAIYSYPHPDDINYYIDRGYFRTYVHIGTYCIGMAVGYVLSARPKLRIPLFANIFGWLISFVMALTVLYGVYEWNQGFVPSLAVSTLYASTCKLVWAMALGWVTIACVTGNGGIVTSILSWQAFVPLSRLTYMAYLIHPIIQHMYIGSTRVMLYSEHKSMTYMFIGNVAAAYIGAFIFSQLFESPFMQLEKVMFRRRIQQHEKSLKNEAVEATSKVQENGKLENGATIFENFPSNKEENGIYGIKIRRTEFHP